jgi:hypothetical protein
MCKWPSRQHNTHSALQQPTPLGATHLVQTVPRLCHHLVKAPCWTRCTAARQAVRPAGCVPPLPARGLRKPRCPAVQQRCLQEHQQCRVQDLRRQRRERREWRQHTLGISTLHDDAGLLETPICGSDSAEGPQTPPTVCCQYKHTHH